MTYDELTQWHKATTDSPAAAILRQWGEDRVAAHDAWMAVFHDHNDKEAYKPSTVFSSHNGAFFGWTCKPTGAPCIRKNSTEFRPRKKGRNPDEVKLLAKVWERIDAVKMPTGRDLFSRLTGADSKGFHRVVGRRMQYREVERYADVGDAGVFFELPTPADGEPPWTLPEGVEPCRYSDVIRAVEDANAAEEGA